MTQWKKPPGVEPLSRVCAALGLHPGVDFDPLNADAMASAAERRATALLAMGTARVGARLPFPLYEIEGRTTRPLGLEMSQNRIAPSTWAYVFELLVPSRAIEIGRAAGGLTLALGLGLGNRLHSYDLCRPNESYTDALRALKVHIVVDDVWKHVEEIARLVQSPGTSYVLCDGGNKIREFQTFAPHLKIGDVIAAHDYDAVHEIDPSVPMSSRPWQWSEIRPRDVADVVTQCGLKPWLQDIFDVAGWLVYRKVR